MRAFRAMKALAFLNIRRAGSPPAVEDAPPALATALEDFCYGLQDFPGALFHRGPELVVRRHQELVEVGELEAYLILDRDGVDELLQVAHLGIESCLAAAEEVGKLLEVRVIH